MVKNKLREMYKEGRKPIGTFFSIGDMSFMECLGYTGLDFVIIDCEHGPFDTETMMDLIRAAESVDLSPIVRIANVDHKEIQRAMDCGADGLIVPCLRTVDEYKELVAWTKFPPVGKRGFTFGRGSGFGKKDWACGRIEDYMSGCNEKTMILPQCETAESLENIEEIAAIDGVDGIFIGPFDFSVSLGIPGQFDDPKFTAALDRVYKACTAAGKPVYIFTTSAADSKAKLAGGASGVACSINAIEVTNVYKKIVADIK